MDTFHSVKKRTFLVLLKEADLDKEHYEYTTISDKPMSDF